MTKGLPASGKTTWAWELAEFTIGPNYVVISKDDIRLDHPNWSEKKVIAERDNLIQQAFDFGCSVISADTNFNPIHEKRLRELANENDAMFSIRDFSHVPVEECIKRDIKRSPSVGEKVIRQMHNQYIRPTLTVMQDPQLPFAVICDLDGTLALLNGRNPYDASDCEYDLLNKPVWNCVRKYLDDGYQLIISSGRSSEYLGQTDRWLGKHGIYPDLFMMRKKGDERPDYDVKREMFLQNVHNKYYVEAVFDDRNQVVQAWRDLGLTCFQVADGYF